MDNKLRYHALKIPSNLSITIIVDGAEVTTLNGKSVKISLNPAMVNDSNIVAADINASNGVIHVIDAVLLPPADAATTAVPQTGDSSQLLYILLASVAGIGLLFFFIRRKALN
jgi:LPXTG-motif cell wall-anchored protein